HRSPILAQFGEVHSGVDWDHRPLAYGRLSIWEGPASDGHVKRLKRRDPATAIGDDDWTPTVGVTNPAPCLELQFADRDRLHGQIVMYFSQPERFSPPSPVLLRPSINADPAAARRRCQGRRSRRRA